MTIAAWIVMVPVYREDRYRDIDVGIPVVDVGKCTLEYLICVAEELELARLHAEAVLAEAAHYLIHGFSGRLVLVE